MKIETTITIEIKDQKITLTREEADLLYSELEKVLGKTHVVPIPYYPMPPQEIKPIWIDPNYWRNPIIYPQIWCTSTGTIAETINDLNQVKLR